MIGPITIREADKREPIERSLSVQKDLSGLCVAFVGGAMTFVEVKPGDVGELAIFESGTLSGEDVDCLPFLRGLPILKTPLFFHQTIC